MINGLKIFPMFVTKMSSIDFYHLKFIAVIPPFKDVWFAHKGILETGYLKLFSFFFPKRNYRKTQKFYECLATLIFITQHQQLNRIQYGYKLKCKYYSSNVMLKVFRDCFYQQNCNNI